MKKLITLKVIQKEINWCRNEQADIKKYDGTQVTPYERGFIQGLRQAKRLIKEIPNSH